VLNRCADPLVRAIAPLGGIDDGDVNVRNAGVSELLFDTLAIGTIIIAVGEDDKLWLVFAVLLIAWCCVNGMANGIP
jgi:hypothetical protein